MFLLQSDIFFWDLTILLLLAFPLAGSIACFYWKKYHASISLFGSFAGIIQVVALLAFLIVLYGSFIEPNLLLTSRKWMKHELAHPVKIAIVSDLHVGPYKGKSDTERVVKHINNLLPDVVVLLGDFIHTASSDLSLLEPLQDLRAPLGVYAVLGNHDVGQYRSIFTGERIFEESRGDEIEGYLEQLDVTVLRNENSVLKTLDGNMVIAGIDDLWAGHYDLQKALSDIPRNTYTILLSHNPSVVDEPGSERAQLILSGHTHGGQIRLPIVGPLSTLPTTLGQEYVNGMFTMEDDTTLIITRGVGETHARARLFAWPEVMLLQLQPST